MVRNILRQVFRSIVYPISILFLFQVAAAAAGPSCPLNPKNQTVTICTPRPNATGLVSPVHVNAGATDSSPVVVMQIYLDGVKVYSKQSVKYIDTMVPMTAGTHRLTVLAKDAAGVIYKTPEYVTVSQTLTVTPSSVTLPPSGTQQFTANLPASWSASCGTIDTSGRYTAPSAAGSCTVTATATDGSGRTGQAKVTVAASTAGLAYTTWKNDNMRTGQQRNETQLTPANVNAAQFGQKFTDPVDGLMYAQPLYVPAAIGAHNVVYLATEHDTVYAYDADAAGPPLWKVSFLSTGVTTVPSANVGSDIFPEIGITSTPVIDTSTGTMYVVAETLENSGTAYVFRLHALNIATGAERAGSPVQITDPNFQPKEQLQRPALLLANGNVYIAFGSQGDHLPYHGWVFAYSPSSLAQVAVWNVTSTGSEGSIWMAGAGLSADSSGNLYAITSNGDWDGVNNFSMSFVKLSPSLQVLDYFTPYNYATLSSADHDLGAGGALLVPDQSGAFPHEVIGCGKPDAIYVVNRDQMGRFQSGSDSQIIQELTGQLGGGGTTLPSDHCFMTAAYWQQKLYFIGNNDVIKMFSLDPASGKLSATPVSKGTFVYKFPGAQTVVSSNGSTNGIVWAVDFSNTPHLHAYDANNVATELYVSPAFGNAVKWSPPTVINGKVYVGTQTQLIVFGH